MRSLGAELSVDLFSRVQWNGYSAAPAVAAYPGFRPTGSWRLEPSGELHGLDTSGDGWRDRKSGEPIDLGSRFLVLAYGSNPDPTKLLNRAEFFGGESVIALRGAVFGWAAGWCDARRRTDRSVVATLVPAPGRMEVHPVLALTAHQLDAMDSWEGQPTFYRRTRHAGPVLLECDRWVNDVEVYLGTPERRPALVIAGRHLLCADVAHADVDKLVAP